MIRELSGGEGFGVGLPGELVFGKAFKKLSRDGRLHFKFCKKRLGDAHGDPPGVWGIDNRGIDARLPPLFAAIVKSEKSQQCAMLT